MKKIVSFFIVLCFCVPVFAEISNSRMTNTAQWTSASRKSSVSGTLTSKSSIRTGDIVTNVEETDDRTAEKNACIANNTGTNNTFVWAAKSSDTSNYTYMVEDTDKPENNACFVKIEIKTTDSNIDLSDIKPIYYQMAENITCGSWVDRELIKQRILDGKKASRTWGAIAGAVGGAGVGVGAMELFGNKAIGGKVEGQKNTSLSQEDVLRSQLLALKKDNLYQYNTLKKQIEILKAECALASSRDECNKSDYSDYRQLAKVIEEIEK